MTDLQSQAESGHVDVAAETLRRFRAATYEGAVAAATAELGPNVQVIEANRIRRGGLGGFFATDLGVEIVVSADSEAGQQIEPRRPSAEGHSADAHMTTSPATIAELAAVEDVLELSDEGMESLFKEIEKSGSRTELRVDSTEPTPGSFAAHLARHAGSALNVVPGTAPVDEWNDGPTQEEDSTTEMVVPTLPSAAEELKRQAARVSEIARRREAAVVSTTDDVEPTQGTKADLASAVPTLPAAADTAVAPVAAETSVTEPDTTPASSPAADRPVEVPATAEAESIPTPRLPTPDGDPATKRARVAPKSAESEPAPAGSAASTDGDDWAETLRHEQEQVRRDESRRQEAARRAQRLEREAAFETVIARRALVDRELSEREDTDYLGLIVATAASTEPFKSAASPAPVPAAATSAPVPSPALVAPAEPRSPEAALADLDELLRRAGVAVPEAPASRWSSATDDVMSIESGNRRSDFTDAVAASEPALTSATAAPTELATAATDHLVSRLADIVAVDGSCLEDLTRVSVAVTTPDGIVVEMVADVDGNDG